MQGNAATDAAALRTLWSSSPCQTNPPHARRIIRIATPTPRPTAGHCHGCRRHGGRNCGPCSAPTRNGRRECSNESRSSRLTPPESAIRLLYIASGTARRNTLWRIHNACPTNCGSNRRWHHRHRFLDNRRYRFGASPLPTRHGRGWRVTIITDDTFGARLQSGFTPVVDLGPSPLGLPTQRGRLIGVPPSEMVARATRKAQMIEESCAAVGIPTGRGTIGREGEYLTITHGRGAARVKLRLLSPVQTMVPVDRASAVLA